MRILEGVFIKNNNSLACRELVVVPLEFFIYQCKHTTVSIQRF